MDSTPFDNPGQLCLRGSLILADPSLRDPNFCRTVLLLTEHRTEFGAHGFILNKPVGKTVGDLLPEAAFKALARVKVYMGGPVSQEKLTFASLAWDAEEKKLIFRTHLGVEDAGRHLADGESVRAFIGYSGWAEGQLEDELKQHAWITRRPAAEVVKMENPDTLWNALLEAMGPWFGLLARMPEDPSLN